MTPEKMLARRASSGGHEVQDTGTLVLSQDGLRQTGRRLFAVACTFAGIWTLVLALFNVIGPLMGGMPALRYAMWPMPGNLIAGSGLLVSLALAWYARRARDGQRLLFAGSVFLVGTCFLFALATFWNPRFDAPVPSWIGLVILGYVGLVHNTPRATRNMGLLAATTAPLTVLLLGALGRKVTATPFAYLLAFLPNYIAALIAVVHAKLIRDLGQKVKQARELGSYRLEELLSRGGMGEVYRASHQLLARPAAIKLIRSELPHQDTPEHTAMMRERFRREAHAAASLRSPHTIDLYEFGVAQDGRFFLAMELLEGLDLEKLVQRYGPLPPARVVHLLRQACDSLEEAHALGMVHRDIKPSNIFACRMGLTVDFVKVLDFGLVKAMDERQHDIKLTAADRAAGTPAYMAPEMITNGSQVDHRADIYCLGCVGYWLLTGRMVFEAAGAMQLLMQHVQAPPVAPSKRGELAVPSGLEQVILDCLAKAPRDRPQSAGELSRRLEAALPDQWTGEDATRWWQRHRPADRKTRTTSAPILVSSEMTFPITKD